MLLFHFIIILSQWPRIFLVNGELAIFLLDHMAHIINLLMNHHHLNS